MHHTRAGAVTLGVALVAHSATAGISIPGRRHPLIQAAAGTALALAVGAPLGLRGAELRSGIRWGAASALVVSGVVAAATAMPGVRAAMAQRRLPQPAWKWLVVQIPLGTVWAEETAYRAALGTVAAGAFGPVRGRALQALAFGLSHVVDARATGDQVLGTVLVTGVAGWVFDVLADRSGSLIGSALAHLAVNEAGAVAAQLVQRRQPAMRVLDSGAFAR